MISGTRMADAAAHMMLGCSGGYNQHKEWWCNVVCGANAVQLLMYMALLLRLLLLLLLLLQLLQSNGGAATLAGPYGWALGLPLRSAAAAAAAAAAGLRCTLQAQAVS
jgi:hypothetical protein